MHAYSSMKDYPAIFSADSLVNHCGSKGDMVDTYPPFAPSVEPTTKVMMGLWRVKRQTSLARQGLKKSTSTLRALPSNLSSSIRKAKGAFIGSFKKPLNEKGTFNSPAENLCLPPKDHWPTTRAQAMEIQTMKYFGYRPADAQTIFRSTCSENLPRPTMDPLRRSPEPNNSRFINLSTPELVQLNSRVLSEQLYPALGVYNWYVPSAWDNPNSCQDSYNEAATESIMDTETNPSMQSTPVDLGQWFSDEGAPSAETISGLSAVEIEHFPRRTIRRMPNLPIPAREAAAVLEKSSSEISFQDVFDTISFERWLGELPQQDLGVTVDVNNKPLFQRVLPNDFAGRPSVNGFQSCTKSLAKDESTKPSTIADEPSTQAFSKEALLPPEDLGAWQPFTNENAFSPMVEEPLFDSLLQPINSARDMTLENIQMLEFPDLEQLHATLDGCEKNYLIKLSGGNEVENSVEPLGRCSAGVGDDFTSCEDKEVDFEEIEKKSDRAKENYQSVNDAYSLPEKKEEELKEDLRIICREILPQKVDTSKEKHKEVFAGFAEKGDQAKESEGPVNDVHSPPEKKEEKHGGVAGAGEKEEKICGDVSAAEKENISWEEKGPQIQSNLSDGPKDISPNFTALLRAISDTSKSSQFRQDAQKIKLKRVPVQIKDPGTQIGVPEKLPVGNKPKPFVSPASANNAVANLIKTLTDNSEDSEFKTKVLKKTQGPRPNIFGNQFNNVSGNEMLSVKDKIRLLESKAISL